MFSTNKKKKNIPTICVNINKKKKIYFNRCKRMHKILYYMNIYILIDVNACISNYAT